MQVKFNCPFCHAKIGADDEFCGMTVQCPGCEQAIRVPSPRFGTGVRLGGYQIEQFLGSGAMGEVYLANQLSMDRPVALKILPKHVAEDEEDRDRFSREIRLLAKLNHQNIVTAFEAGEDEGCQFLAMGYIDGVSLDERLDREKTLPEPEALDICIKVAEALKYAWDRFELLHRDIKPANIMLDRYGEVKLMDMGIAKTRTEESNATMAGMVIGTPYYMSPEQARAEEDLDFRSDLYGLGATLYHLVTGKYTHNGPNPMDILTQKLTTMPPPARQVNPAVTPACEALLIQMLALDPDERPSSWDDALVRMRRVREGKIPTSGPNTPPVRKRKMRVGHPTVPTLQHADIGEAVSEIAALEQRRPVAGIIFALLVAAAAAAAAFFLLGPGKKMVDTPPTPATPANVQVSQTTTTPAPVEPPPQEPPVDAAAAAAKLAEESKRLAELKQRAEAATTLLNDAIAFDAANPFKFDAILAEYQKAAAAGRDTPVGDAAYAKVEAVRAQRQLAMDQLLAQLAHAAMRPAREKRWTEVARIYSEYTGPLANETAGSRREMASWAVDPDEDQGELLVEIIRATHDFKQKFNATPVQVPKPRILPPVTVTPPTEIIVPPVTEPPAVVVTPPVTPVTPPVVVTPPVTTVPPATTIVKPPVALPPAAPSPLEILTAEVAAQLLRSDFDAARRSVGSRPDAIEETLFTKLAERTREITRMQDMCLEGFRKDIGNTITVQFNAGPETFTLQEVTSLELKGYQEIKTDSASGKLGKRFRVADVTTAEYLRRLEMSGTSELTVMRGILAARLRRYDIADDMFKQAGGPLGAALGKELLKSSPALRESHAMDDLRAMLRDLGITDTSDPTGVRRQLETFKLTDARMAEIRATAAAYRAKHASTTVVAEQAPLLDMLTEFGKLVWPPDADRLSAVWDANLPDSSNQLRLRGEAIVIAGKGLQIGKLGGAMLQLPPDARVVGREGVAVGLYMNPSEISETPGQILSIEDDERGYFGLYQSAGWLVLEYTSLDQLVELKVGTISAGSSYVSLSYERERKRLLVMVDGKQVVETEVNMDIDCWSHGRIILGASRRADRPWAGSIDSVTFYRAPMSDVQLRALYHDAKEWHRSRTK